MNAIAGVIIVLIIVVFSGYVIAALRGMTKEDRMIDDNEFSMGQEDRIVVIEDVVGEEDE
jgi:hypothetical protein